VTSVSMTSIGIPEPIPAARARLVANEAAKGLRLAWRRRAMVVVAIAMNLLTYLGISLFIGGGRLVEELMVLTLPALLAMMVAAGAAVQGSGGIAEEINGGTLEQSQLGPAPPQLQVLGRIVALAVEAIAAAAVVGAVFVLVLDLPYEFHRAVPVPAVLTLADALGYALVVTALTVRVASIGAITHVFNMVIMVFGGMIVPITLLPDAVANVARFVPIALGVEATNATLAGASLSAVWADGTLPWLVVHTVVSCALGVTAYVVNIRRALREGALGPR
jgi:ABC-2 type transport system permease protein